MRKISILIVLFLLALLQSSAFIVPQGMQDILVRSGVLVKDHKTEQALVYLPGLHWKIPFIEEAKELPNTLQSISSSNETLLTQDKQSVVLNAYLKWKITNPSLYYAVSDGGNTEVIQNILNQVFSQLLSELVSQYPLKKLTDNTLTLSKELKDSLNQGNSNTNVSKIINLSSVLNHVDPALLKGIDNHSVAALGIKIMDVGISKILPPTDKLSDIYDKMNNALFTKVGQVNLQTKESVQKNQDNAQEQADKIIGAAQQQAAKIRGEADASSAKQYVGAFKDHVDFYSFIRGLEVYEKSFESGDNTIILTPDGHFLNYIDTLKK